MDMHLVMGYREEPEDCWPRRMVATLMAISVADAVCRRQATRGAALLPSMQCRRIRRVDNVPTSPKFSDSIKIPPTGGSCSDRFRSDPRLIQPMYREQP